MFEPGQFTPMYGTYQPAFLTNQEGMGWVIIYHVFNPITNELERKRIKMNRVRAHFGKMSEFRVYANSVICTINAKLAGGWSPFGEMENSRYYTPLVEALDRYYQEKERELRDKSLSSYKSQVDILKTWINENVPNIKGVQFNQVIAARYLDYVYMDRKVSNTVYNNYLKHCRLFFNWAVEKCYTKENPFTHFKTKQKEKKKRVLIPAPERVIITDYIRKKRPSFLLVCHLVFTALIRPIEISRIKVKQVHLKDKYIYLPEEQTKNKHERCAPLSDELVAMLAEVLVGADMDDYLIGADFKPGKVALNVLRYSKTWAKMRDGINKGCPEDSPIIPDSMQLYSLRDTGINLMLKNGIDPVNVMHAADHHDLSITTKYADHHDPLLIQCINEHAPKFYNKEVEDCSEAPELTEIIGGEDD